MRFLFVTGDIGGANYQLPVIRKLRKTGHEVEVYADSEGKGHSIFVDAGIPFKMEFNPEDWSSLWDMAFINTCASATHLEQKIYQEFRKRTDAPIPIVFGCDDYFNHALPVWRKSEPDIWFAIDEGHAQAIRDHKFNSESVKCRVVGQPAFDRSLRYLDRRSRNQEIDLNIRRMLGTSPDNKQEINILWWSQGTLEVIYEDIFMVGNGLYDFLERYSDYRINFFPRLHPKLNGTVEAGFLDSALGHLRKILGQFTDSPSLEQRDRVNFKGFDIGTISNEQLCLASDVILSVTSTEDVKNTLIGGPPVVHLIGPQTRKWLERNLCLHRPYLPDLASGRSLVAWSVTEVADRIHEALQPEVQARLLKSWHRPQQKATDLVAEALIDIASNFR